MIKTKEKEKKNAKQVCDVSQNKLHQTNLFLFLIALLKQPINSRHFLFQLEQAPKF